MVNTETVDVVLSVEVLVDDGDDDAMTLLAGLNGSDAELVVGGFAFDAKLTRVALPGKI